MTEKAQRQPQISTTVGPYVRALYDELCTEYSSGSVVLTLAVRDLHQRHFGRLSDEAKIKRGAVNVLCAECGELVDPASNWQPGSNGCVYCAKCVGAAQQSPKENKVNRYFECKSCGQVVQGFEASRQVECCDHPDYREIDSPDADDEASAVNAPPLDVDD